MRSVVPLHLPGVAARPSGVASQPPACAAAAGPYASSPAHSCPHQVAPVSSWRWWSAPPPAWRAAAAPTLPSAAPTCAGAAAPAVTARRSR